MRPFFKRIVLERPAPKPMIIVVDTTKAGSATNTFILPIIKDASETVKIYWGDGTNSVGATGDNTHVYASSGVYTVRIASKIFGGIKFNNLGDKAKITSVVSFGNGVTRLLFSAFFGCSSITSMGNGYLTSLTTTTTTQAMLYGCAALTTVPLFDLSKVTTTVAMFQSCASLTTVPLFNLSKTIDTNYMFYNCTALATVPLFDLSKVTNVSGMFRDCTSLTTIPLFNLSSVTNAASMFSGVTLATTSYSDFLINLATLPLKSGVTFHGGSSKYNTAGGVARAYLISTFGWTITDGGAAP